MMQKTLKCRFERRGEGGGLFSLPTANSPDSGRGGALDRVEMRGEFADPHRQVEVCQDKVTYVLATLICILCITLTRGPEKRGS